MISQNESFEAEYLLLSCDKTVKKSSLIAQYALFMGPAFLIRSTRQIRHIVGTENDTKHPTIIDGRHTLVKLFVSCSLSLLAPVLRLHANCNSLRVCNLEPSLFVKVN